MGAEGVILGNHSPHTIVVTWTSIRKRGIREGRKIIGSFFFFNEKKHEVRNVKWNTLPFFFSSFETKSNCLATLNLSFLIL